MERSRFKDYLLLIAFAALLLLVVVHFDTALSFLGRLLGELYPIILACIIAFVLNVPMTVIGNQLEKLFKGKKKRPKDETLGIISLLLTVLALLLIIVLVATTAVPGLVQSVRSIFDLVQKKLPEVLAYLESWNLDTDLIQSAFQQLDLSNLLKNLTSNAGSVVSVVVGTASSTIGAVTTFIIGMVISVYIMLNKRTLTHQAKALAYANLKKERADRLCYIASLTNSTYSKFLSGQCIEAVILGLLLFVSLSIAKVPYAGVLAVLTGIMSFVPMVGAFLACFIGVILVLMVSPIKALICLAVFLCVQFVEGQFIYPKVVGNSVGLPSMWTLIAVLIGGNLFGIVGMLFFIPLTAVLYTLVTENTRKKLKRKKLNIP